MKKQVIFAIGVIVLLSVIVVTFFGTQVSIDQFQVYMNKIEFTNYDFMTNYNQKMIEVAYDPALHSASVLLQYTYAPDDATHPEHVKFILENATYTNPTTGETTVYATIERSGLVTFHDLTRSRLVRVTIRTTDGSNLSDTVEIYCQVKSA
ncbi:MAG: hypothetical protein NC133_04420 [Prevotella sp.]|nr:hypothetical protein [Prevotella sp.]